jgi:hypothetical protein
LIAAAAFVSSVSVHVSVQNLAPAPVTSPPVTVAPDDASNGGGDPPTRQRGLGVVGIRRCSVLWTGARNRRRRVAPAARAAHDLAMRSGAKIQRDERIRRGHEVTLSDKAWENIRRLAAKRHDGNRSAAIEAWALAISVALALLLAGCGGADGGPLTAPEMVAAKPADTVATDGGAKPDPKPSGDSQNVDAGDSGVYCPPFTCSTLAPQTGTLSDGCGGTIVCADPPPGSGEPMTDDAGSPCVPAMCGGITGGGAYTIPDGCGHTLQCPGENVPDAGPPPVADAGLAPAVCFVDNPAQCCTTGVAACCRTPQGPYEDCVSAYGLQPAGVLGVQQTTCYEEVPGCQRTGTCCQ